MSPPPSTTAKKEGLVGRQQLQDEKSNWAPSHLLPKSRIIQKSDSSCGWWWFFSHLSTKKVEARDQEFRVTLCYTVNLKTAGLHETLSENNV